MMKARATRPLVRIALLALLALFGEDTGFPASAQSQAPASPGASSAGLTYTVAIEPRRPELGGLVTVDLSVAGITAASARVATLSLDPGLSLESQSQRPIVLQAARGTAFHFELRISKAGELRMESLEISAAEGSLSLGPLLVCNLPQPASAAGRTWHWVAPPEALRYEAFEARLESEGELPEGASREVPTAAFLPPQGSSFEASGQLTWTVIAFEEGELVLPKALLGGRQGIATAARVAIKALPQELASSRAIGTFTLSIEGPSPAAPLAGATTRVRLVLSGRGNLPVLLIPPPRVSLGSTPLSPSSWSSRRTDDARAEGGSYLGSTSLILDLSPPRAGTMTLSFPPLQVFDPLSGIVSLELPPLAIAVRNAASPARGGEGGGQALADLYKELRRSDPFSARHRAARKEALARAAELVVEGPLLDPLPPPSWFAWPAGLCLLAALAVLAPLLRRPRRELRNDLRSGVPGEFRRRPVRSGLLLALALGLGTLALVSAAERRASYAVVWTDTLRVVPSADSELRLRVVRGSTAKTRGSSGKFESLVLSDGVEGWAPRDSLYWY